MRSRMAAAALAFSCVFGSDQAAAASLGAAAQNPRTAHTAGVSAHRRNHLGGRPYSAYYLGRPIYYSPGPLFPWLPFIADWRDPLDW
jgi:hypothetical protein